MAPVLLTRIAGTTRRVLATTAVVSLALFAVHFIWATYRPPDLSYWLLAVVGSAIAGCIGGGLTGTALWLYCRREQEVATRMQDIIELNHNVRNALQIIAYSHQFLPQHDARAVVGALTRIEQALRTVSGFRAPSTELRQAEDRSRSTSAGA